MSPKPLPFLALLVIAVLILAACGPGRRHRGQRRLRRASPRAQ